MLEHVILLVDDCGLPEARNPFSLLNISHRGMDVHEIMATGLTQPLTLNLTSLRTAIGVKCHGLLGECGDDT